VSLVAVNPNVAKPSRQASKAGLTPVTCGLKAGTPQGQPPLGLGREVNGYEKVLFTAAFSAFNPLVTLHSWQGTANIGGRLKLSRALIFRNRHIPPSR
jgi:hypothetical protein